MHFNENAPNRFWRQADFTVAGADERMSGRNMASSPISGNSEHKR
jgi:hypothetical protein